MCNGVKEAVLMIPEFKVQGMHYSWDVSTGQVAEPNAGSRYMEQVGQFLTPPLLSFLIIADNTHLGLGSILSRSGFEPDALYSTGNLTTA